MALPLSLNDERSPFVERPLSDRASNDLTNDGVLCGEVLRVVMGGMWNLVDAELSLLARADSATDEGMTVATELRFVKAESRLA